MSARKMKSERAANEPTVYSQLGVRIEPRYRRMINELAHDSRITISAMIERLIGQEYMRQHKLKILPED